MALTLEDLDRRVTALEQSSKSEDTITRAVAEIVAESEKRVQAEMKTETHRLTAVVSAAERRMVDTLNDRFDQVMAALDGLKNPPA